MGTFYDTIMKAALEAVGLPATRPAPKDEPARPGVRLHDLRHTSAVLQLSVGVHFMQVSKWLGHSTFTLTLDLYGDYIPEEDGGALNTSSAHLHRPATFSRILPPRRRCCTASWMCSRGYTPATGTTRAPSATSGAASRMTGTTLSR
jgi:integrase